MKEYKNSTGMTISLKQYVINHLKNGELNDWWKNEDKNKFIRY